MKKRRCLRWSSSTLSCQGAVRIAASLRRRLSRDAVWRNTCAQLRANLPFERCLAMQNIDHVFVSAGIPYSYGFAIIALTLAVKVATFPLTKKQARLCAATMSVQSDRWCCPCQRNCHLRDHALSTALIAIARGLYSPDACAAGILQCVMTIALVRRQPDGMQVQSTMAMQALQPSVKQLQAQYANEPEKLQVETQRLYKEAQVNPLAGCLPTLATIPVFIGLYRALTLAASDGLLNEGFFFVPSLGGPTTTAQQAANQGMQWLFPFVDGVPPLGWETTAKYLVLPVLLVLSQFASLQISQPAQSDDPAQQTTQKILKFIPFMIGAQSSHLYPVLPQLVSRDCCCIAFGSSE